jgi:site-specific DNA recombinase
MKLNEDTTGVAIYVRSSKDRHDVSCEAQKNDLTEYAEKQGYTNIYTFEDKALSSTRDPRPQYDKMISAATSSSPPFKKIICTDTSRLGRDNIEKTILIHRLRKKHGIEVVFKNMPNTGSYMDEVMEQIISSFDQMYSHQCRVKGVAGMKQNIKNGYRAGGRAPYGYKLKEVVIGKHRDGKTMTKTQLMPDPETAPYVKEYFTRRARHEPRKAILEDFHNKGVPTPSSSTQWAVSTAKSMEDNIETYLGHTVFNKHNERLKKSGKPDGYKGGKKWRPREEWVMTENTHEPLITKQDAEIIISNKEKGLRDRPYNKKTYPLTGVLKCNICNSNFTGDSGYYRCNSKHKIGCRCSNGGISQGKIESALSSLLSDVVLDFDNLKKIITKIKERCQPDDTSIVSDLKKQFQKNAIQRTKLIKLHMADLIDPDELKAELMALKEQKTKITSTIKEVSTTNQDVNITSEDIKKTIENLSKEIKHASPEILRMVFNNLFQEIKISPKNKKSKHPQSRIIELKGISIPFTGVKVASPRGFEPLSPA